MGEEMGISVSHYILFPDSLLSWIFVIRSYRPSFPAFAIYRLLSVAFLYFLIKSRQLCLYVYDENLVSTNPCVPPVPGRRLPPEPDEEEVPREWIGWKGQQAVALLSTYPAGTRLCGIGLEPGDEMLFLRVAMDANGQFLFDAPTAYKFAFRHVLDDPAINRIIVELSTLNKQENEHLASIDLFPLCKIDSEPRMNYYVINRDWD
jgi:hypothetical protein